MTNRLAGKVAIVTGSSSGIGQAITIRFAAEGASVVIDYVGHPESANATKAQIEMGGGKAIIAHDVSNLASYEAAYITGSTYIIEVASSATTTSNNCIFTRERDRI
jgi:NAD(P)-dependent dehydrogenase (short-subunit alcohol dehydrogenase family)